MTTFGGLPTVAPSMREVPLESNTEALSFLEPSHPRRVRPCRPTHRRGDPRADYVVDRVAHQRDAFLAALARTRIVARGPKPVAVLRELKIPVWLTAPEPNTWKELVSAIDGRQSELSLQGARVAVQEYGVSNPDLLAALESRGALVTRVPVYQWALPDDLEPLRAAVRALAAGNIDVVMFTTSMQVVHLLRVAESMQMESATREGLHRTVIASIGPTTSDELRQRGFTIDLEPSHPKMGFLVRETAERAGALLTAKRA